MHPGEDVAQKAIFTRAHRVADWAHVIGACTRPKGKQDRASQDERICAYRADAFATVSRHLSAAGRKMVPLVQRAFHCLRSLPTALVFHTVAQLLFATLNAQNPSEEKAAKALQRYYFVTLPAVDARSQFALEDWPGDPQKFVTSDWWSGLQRLQPGSASGTQAQEAWHRQKLKKHMGLNSALTRTGRKVAKLHSV
eukprot:s33_g33.t1